MEDRHGFGLAAKERIDRKNSQLRRNNVKAGTTDWRDKRR
jgi:hypothetical protein